MMSIQFICPNATADTYVFQFGGKVYSRIKNGKLLEHKTETQAGFEEAISLIDGRWYYCRFNSERSLERIFEVKNLTNNRWETIFVDAIGKSCWQFWHISKSVTYYRANSFYQEKTSNESDFTEAVIELGAFKVLP